MGKQDPQSNCKVLPMTLPKDYVDTAPTGTDNLSIDCLGFEFALILIAAGVLTSGTTWAATVQDSADDSSFADVEATPGANTKVTLGPSDDGEVHALSIECQAVRRYLKLAWAKTGTWTVSLLQASAVLLNASDSAYVTSTNIDGQYIGV